MAYDIDTDVVWAELADPNMSPSTAFRRLEQVLTALDEVRAELAELEATRANEKHEERRRSFEAEKYEQRLAELAARVERTEADAANLRIGLEVERHATDEYRDRAEAAEARIIAALTIFEEDRSGPNAATANAMYLGLAGEDHG